MLPGGMLFVISHQIIPESRRKGREAYVPGGLMLGFVIMMLLGTALSRAASTACNQAAAPISLHY